MQLLFASSALLLTLATSVNADPKPSIVLDIDIQAECKTCPYGVCPNTAVYRVQNATVTCWTESETVGDSNLWLKTTDKCYASEFEFKEYPGELREDLNYCGKVPLNVTKQAAKTKYLTQCHWEPSTAAEGMQYYDRDLDLTLTCWSEGFAAPMGDKYWYKTMDNCRVSGSGLWKQPDRAKLEHCGVNSGPRLNQSSSSFVAKKEGAAPKAINKTDKTDKPQKKSLLRRWLQPSHIGQEYAPCYSCPNPKSGTKKCELVKTYEYNDTVISQCLSITYPRLPNGTDSIEFWMLTTDWCYVLDSDFDVPPWDNYRYPRCHYWKGYE